jgi:pimeloyl-ACP methyl ester carboxylesterase
MIKTVRANTFGLVLFAFFLSCEGKNYRHDEIVSIPSQDTTLSVKLSYPEKWTKKDKIIVWSMPTWDDAFLSDTTCNGCRLWICPVMRQQLLDSGYLNIEYIGRNDSVIINNHKYRKSDMHTKSADLENLLSYIQSVKQLKNKKILLIGHSEGCDINSIVASNPLSRVSAIVQLAAPCESGKKTTEYMRLEKNSFESMLHFSYGINFHNKSSSLDSNYKSDEKNPFEGYKLFIKEHIDPLDSIIYKFDAVDSIYLQLNLYLQDQWNREDEETKKFYRNDYKNYYQLFAGYIDPWTIALRKFDPEKYYPFIHCPVLAVHGTEDERVDCYPNIENMDRLLKKGGNLNFEKRILEGYDHSLTKRKKRQYMIEDHVINGIIEWIEKQ